MGFLDNKWARAGLGAAAGFATTPYGIGAIPGAIAGYLSAPSDINKPKQMSNEQSQSLMDSRTNALENQRQMQANLLNTYHGNVRNLQAAIPRGEAAIRANIAQRLSATMAGVPVGSGAGLASASQSGYDADMASARYGMETAGQLGQARTDAATAAYEASLPENRVMTADEQRIDLMNQWETRKQAIIKNNTSWKGINEEKAYREMLADAAKEPDPELRAQMEADAKAWFDDENWS